MELFNNHDTSTEPATEPATDPADPPSTEAMNDLDRTAHLALRIAQRCVSTYTSPYSRRDFTQPQLLACLILRGSMGLTYRATCRLLERTPSLRRTLGLTKVPHFTTLERTHNSDGMLACVDAMLHQLMLELGDGRRPDVDEIAVDSTGLHATGASAYFERRTSKNAVFLKLSAVVICGVILPCAMQLSWGRSSDMTQGLGVVRTASANVRAQTLYADAGYDGERLHELCRDELGIASYIKPVVRARDGSIRTRHRSRMRSLPSGYSRRSHAESFFSALKRRTGVGLRARGLDHPKIEAAMRVLGYAVAR